VGNSLRYLGCALGFGFGVAWMTVGLGSAILCVLLAGLGYGAVFMAERAQVNGLTSRAPEADALSLSPDALGVDRSDDDELSDATSPLAAEAEYGWPWPISSEAENGKKDHAPVTDGA
jgi:hypothetical protein